MIRCLVMLIILVASQQVLAISYLKIGFEKIDGAQIKARDINITINDLDRDNSRLRFKAQQLKTRLHQQAEVSRLSFDCKNLQQLKNALLCKDSELSFDHPLVHADNTNLTFDLNTDTFAISAEIANLNLLNGQVSVRMHRKASSSGATLKLKQLAITPQVFKRLQASFQNPSEYSVAEFSAMLSGEVSIAQKRKQQQLSADIDLHFNDIAFSNETGDLLGEGLTGRLKTSLKQASTTQGISALKLNSTIALKKGEVLTPWFYSSFADRPLTLDLNDLQFTGQQWSLKSGQIDDGHVSMKLAKLGGSKNAESTFLQQGQLTLDPLKLENVYDFYLAPVLTNDLARLSVSGNLSANLTMEQSKPVAYQVKLGNVDLQHQPLSGSPKYAFNKLDLALKHSSDNSTASASYLDFKAASFLENIRFGQLHLPLKVSSQKLSVAQNSRLPVFDGDLIIEDFSMDFSQKAPQFEFKGILTPISLSNITAALDWPVMNGKISGLIPSVTYHDGNARIAGTLLIRAFDGNILLKNVQASHLLSSWPVLKADVAVKNIDLQKLTETFSFGKITGEVDGYARNLVLENWRPTSFDAQLLTAESDKPRRISQKAVDNISNLGGAGMAGALSRSFMRFFEDFGYDKLGFNCELKNGICQMSGVADANQGYYLVKGGGIPRIDVIGHNRTTDWNTLVDRLVNMTSAGSPTIQ